MTDPETPVPLDRLLAHRAWVRAVARALVDDRNDADDVEQQTWLAALRRPPRRDASVRGWLGAAARNVARKLGRGEGRRARRETAAARPEGAAAPDVADLVAEAELQQRIGRDVLELDEPFRAVVLLRYFEALPVADIAARLGVPDETVRSRLRRAHEKLRARLDEADGPRRGAWAVAVLAWTDGPFGPPPVVPIAAGATVGTATAAGGVAMTLAKKLVVATALVAAIGATTWVAVRDDGGAGTGARPGGAEADPTAAARGETTGRAKRARDRTANAEDTASAAREADVLPPVDLDRADRDLDLHGRVVTADDGPVAGAAIATVTYPWRPIGVLNIRDRDVEVAGPATRSASDGTFAMRLARGDSVNLRVSAPGFASVELSNVLAGERLKVVMRPGVRLVVVLSDAAGGPLASAKVRLFNNNLWGGPVIRMRGVADADGVCTFEGLPPSAWAWIAPEHPKGYGGRTRVDLPAAGELRTEIRVPAGRVLTGSVVDGVTRAPIAGARVGMNWVLDMAVTTKEDGTFELPGWTGNGVDDVHVQAEGYAREGKVVGDATRLDFELTRGYAVTGRIVDPSAQPVAGALVSLIASEHVGNEPRTSDGYATTGSDGRFRVTSLRLLMHHAIIVASPGFARLRRPAPDVYADPDAASTDLDLGDVALSAPRRLEGVVVGTDGSPHPRVSVAVIASQMAPGSGYGAMETRSTDDLGRFRFAGLAPGAYRVLTKTPGAPDVAVNVALPADRDVLDLRIERETLVALTVRVTDETGSPVAGAMVSVSGASSPVNGRTDASGTARLSVTEARGQMLSVHHAGDGPRAWLPTTPFEIKDVGAGVTVVLRDAAFIEGRLVDPDGAAVAGAVLEATGPTGVRTSALAGADGRFRILVERTGPSLLVFDGMTKNGPAYADSGLAARAEDVAPGADLVVRCRRVESDRRLAVSLKSPTGDPVAGATVFVSGPEGPIASAKTDADGRAAFKGLPAKELHLSVGFAPGFDGGFAPPAGRTVLPAGQDVELRGRVATRLTGVVVRQDGAGVPAVAVTALRGGVWAGMAQTDRDGRFSILIPADEPGRLQLEADANRDGRPETVEADVAPDAQDVRLVLGAKPK